MVSEWQDFTVAKLIKSFKSLSYGFGGHSLNIRVFRVDVEPRFKGQ